jgi:lipid-A-disaccharide synthase
MEKEGLTLYENLASKAIVGFWEVLRKIGYFKELFKKTIEWVKEEKPDALILIDYPGFNLRLAKEAKRLGFKVIYYISPQVWAWGTKRVKILKEFVDEIIVLFKFEEEFYAKFGINVKFVGHPLLDLITPDIEEDAFLKKYGLPPDKKRVFLMPGSRDGEVIRHLPILLKAIEGIYKNDRRIEFLFLKSPYLKKEIQIPKGLPIHVISGDNYNAIYYSHAGIVASGTATFESAVLGTPFLIIYKTSFLNYLILKPQIKVPYIGIVNIIMGKEIIPEFIQNRCRPEIIRNTLEKFLYDEGYYRKAKENLKRFRQELGEKGAARRAAEYILGKVA